jgi:2-keto-4-pentenoate hydratase/2-oxohepta-3-ene-1,7-dioic acid hydratase in catechol pathway
MKICWFNDDRLGLVVGTDVLDVSEALRVLPPQRFPGAAGDLLVAHLDRVRLEIVRIQSRATRKSLTEVRLLSPVARPGKIIGVPVNFPSHVQEAESAPGVFKQYDGGIEDQGLFLKASSSLIGCGQAVQIRFPERQTHHEVELGVVIGRAGSNIARDHALSHVAGYTIALDMTVRGGEDRSFRKSIDTYSVLGPWLTTADEIPDPQVLALTLSVNDVVRQQSNTRHMIMKIARQIEWASTFYTLQPGDVIMSGTPEGVSRVLPGDFMQASIEGLGSMHVRVE